MALELTAKRVPYFAKRTQGMVDNIGSIQEYLTGTVGDDAGNYDTYMAEIAEAKVHLEKAAQAMGQIDHEAVKAKVKASRIKVKPAEETPADGEVPAEGETPAAKPKKKSKKYVDETPAETPSE